MRNFTLDLTRIVNKTKLRVDTVVQKVTFDIFKTVIMRSPVDTGRFRANFIARSGSYSTATVETFDKSGSATVSAMASVALGTKAGGIVFLTNSLPYAIPLEYGHSQRQAPQGMVRITVLEYQQFIRNAVGA